MGFQNEMKQMFLHVAAGNVEPEEWEKWWNSNKARLEAALTRGDRVRMMPALWSADYYWMVKTQSGIAYYFHAQGRPVKTSGYYEEKAKEEGIRLLPGGSGRNIWNGIRQNPSLLTGKACWGRRRDRIRRRRSAIKMQGHRSSGKSVKMNSNCA